MYFPLYFRIGGQLASIIGAGGSGIANIVTGIFLAFEHIHGPANIAFLMLLFSFNDFFQTFCTTAICKVGVNWYHISERGLFSGIFGVVIAYGFFLALQVNAMIRANFHVSSVFFIPGTLLLASALACVFFVKATPEDAGLRPVTDEALAEQGAEKSVEKSTENTANSDPNAAINNSEKKAAEQKSGRKDYGMPLPQLLKHLFLNPVFLLLCVVDFCVGWCRDGIIQNYGLYLKLYWGMAESSVPYSITTTGVTLGSMFGSFLAGLVSDFCCGSRRPPVAFVAMILFSLFILMTLLARAPWLAALGIGLTSFSFSCVHGIITSTCAMDFAGPRATGTAVGILDGIQKIGSALTGVVMGAIFERWGGKGWLVSFFPASGVGALLLIPILGKKPNSAQKKEEKKDADEQLPLLSEKETASTD